MAKVGTVVRIIDMQGEPHYNGKTGTITHVSEGYPPAHIEEQWYGTWGGLAIQPWRDKIEILEEPVD